MKKELVLRKNEYTKDGKKFEMILKKAIEEYLKNYDNIYRQNIIKDVKYI